MSANDKRVILISGDSTKWYEQAIFILRRGQSKDAVPKDFIGEAEGIVHAYLNGGNTTAAQAFSPAPPLSAVSPNRPQAKRKRTNFVLNLMMLLSCAALTALLVFHFLR